MLLFSKKGIIVYTIEEVNTDASIVAHFHSGINVASSDTMRRYSVLTYRGKRVRKTIKRRQVMAREGDVTRVFLARASLHYDAARAALPFCRSCGDTVSRSRYSVEAHQARHVHRWTYPRGQRWRATGCSDNTYTTRIDFPWDERRDADYASNGNGSSRFNRNNFAPRLSSHFLGNSKITTWQHR